MVSSAETWCGGASSRRAPRACRLGRRAKQGTNTTQSHALQASASWLRRRISQTKGDSGRASSEALISLQFNGVFGDIQCETDQYFDTKGAGRCGRPQSDRSVLDVVVVREKLAVSGLRRNPICSANSHNAILRDSSRRICLLRTPPHINFTP
jgi:hypothetical protein